MQYEAQLQHNLAAQSKMFLVCQLCNCKKPLSCSTVGQYELATLGSPTHPRKPQQNGTKMLPSSMGQNRCPRKPSHFSPTTLTVFWDCCCPAFHHSRCSFLSFCSYCWQGMPTLVLCEAVAGHIILPCSPNLRRRQTLHLENGIHPIPTMLRSFLRAF